MIVFVASSRKYYDRVKMLKAELDKFDVKGYYPYFDLPDIEGDDERKKQVTLQHFPEIDQVDTLYIVAPAGYVGYSVTIETAYAYAKGKRIISSEPITEFAVRALVSEVMTPDEFVASAGRR